MKTGNRPTAFRLILALFGFVALMASPALAQLSVNTWGQGGLRIGDSTTTCDSSAEGGVRYNNTTNYLQYCNGGGGWQNFGTGVLRYGLTDGGTIAVDWGNGPVQSVTMAGNRTFTFTGGEDGGRYTLIIKQDGTGSRTATWPASVRWGGGTAPTLTTTASKTDYIGFIYNGVDSKYDGIAISKNF